MIGLRASVSLLVVVGAALGASPARAEVILQYFETPWAEIEARMPEIAAAGYDAVWLPPPTKGTEGIRDVGFAVYDRFDLGDKDARGTVATRYGTRAELRAMVDAAHRFGVRVYFDVVMNHNGNPNGIENIGVELPMVDLGAFPSTSVWDYHVLPAREQAQCAGIPNCAWCARQPGATADDDFTPSPPGSFDGKQWRVLNPNGSYINATGGEVCVCPTGQFVSEGVCQGNNGEDRVAAMSLGEALEEEGAPAMDLPIFDGMTHILRGPRMTEFTDFEFQVMNWALLGLHDFATEQYEDGDGPTPLDGTNAILGTPLPVFVRNPDDPETYAHEPEGAPYPEDIRAYLMRWIRWLMIETRADGFRLDAIKHIWPNFFGADYQDDRIAFVKVIQDTYDEMHGFNDADDADLVDDAAVFGEDFTGSCAALKPYIQTGMRALDFPLFFNLGTLMAGNGDIGSYSANNVCDDASIGAFHGLDRRSGVAFAHSHDECQKNESPDTSNVSPNFSRCFENGSGNQDMVYAYILLREADATVFFDGNRWTPDSFVRSGRPDGLVEQSADGPLDTVPVLVAAARRVARGTMHNVWVGADGYAFERRVGGLPSGLVALNDRMDASIGWGNDASTGSFIVTTFLPGTELCELTGNALFGDGCVEVLDPAALAPDEQPEVSNARANFQAANGQPPPGGHGVIYTGLPAGPVGNYVVYAPPAMRVSSGDDDVLEILDVPTATLAPGMHALHVRFRRSIAGAAAAQDEIVLPLCVPNASGTAVCGTASSAAAPTDDAVATGLVALQVDGAPAPRIALESAPARELPDGTGVDAAVVHALVVDGASLDLVVTIDAALATDDVAIRIDADSDLVPGFHLVSTPERFLDGFTKLFPPGVDPPDAGPSEGEGEGEGEGEPDAGPVDPDGDDDGDGVRNADDNCRDERNVDQADFDEDAVGDACDACPTTAGAVSAGGCTPISAEDEARIRAIARAIAEKQSSAEFDEDGDGDVDVVDLDRAIAAASERAGS